MASTAHARPAAIAHRRPRLTSRSAALRLEAASGSRFALCARARETAFSTFRPFPPAAPSPPRERNLKPSADDIYTLGGACQRRFFRASAFPPAHPFPPPAPSPTFHLP